jgi:hypothetical protein
MGRSRLQLLGSAHRTDCLNCVPPPPSHNRSISQYNLDIPPLAGDLCIMCPPGCVWPLTVLTRGLCKTSTST